MCICTFYLWAESQLFTYYLVSSYNDADHRYDAETKPVGVLFLTSYWNFGLDNPKCDLHICGRQEVKKKDHCLLFVLVLCLV